jgi:hypothetical protein
MLEQRAVAVLRKELLALVRTGVGIAVHRRHVVIARQEDAAVGEDLDRLATTQALVVAVRVVIEVRRRPAQVEVH